MSGSWLLLTAGESRQHAGNEGYDDRIDAHYSWDSSVPNSAKISEGDRIALWDATVLLGVAVIERIDSLPGTKTLRRCPNPSCRQTTLKHRLRKRPRYACYRCGTETDSPVLEEREVTLHRASYAPRWVDLTGALNAAELRSACLVEKSIHSMRPLDWERLLLLLQGRAPDRLLATIGDSSQPSVPGGYREIRARARVGQSDFRAALIGEFGEVCAFTGAAPGIVLEAAHLYSYSEVQKHHSHGGLLLRRDVHRLFDRGDLAVNPADLRIDADPELATFSAYASLHGQELRANVNDRHMQWMARHWKQHRA